MSKRLFIIIWTLISISYAVNFLRIFFAWMKGSESLFAYLTSITLIILSVSFFTGFYIYLMVGPWLLNKHGIKSFRESYLGFNWIYSEIDIKKFEPTITDPSFKKTLIALKACKVGIVLGVLLLPLFGILTNA